MTLWQDHVAQWRDCQRCALAQQRSNIVLARGRVPCDVLFVGEAPGESEDALAQPFRGPAGQLLDQIIERSVPDTLRCAMTNLVACFPREAKHRGDNEPEPEEIQACQPRLAGFIAIAAPRLVVRVGGLASAYLEHDAWGRIAGAAVADIIHPAAILRMPLAQQHGAAQRSIVVIRSAIEDMLEREANRAD